MKNMIYEAQGKQIDLTKLTRLYPAATVDVHGEMALQCKSRATRYNDTAA